MTAYPDPMPTSYREWVSDADRRTTEPRVDGDAFLVDPDGTVHADPRLLTARAEREPDLDALRARREPSIRALRAEREPSVDALIAEREYGAPNHRH